MERVARLSSRLESEGTLYSGKPADVLIGLTETVDILVMGSRGYGPLKAVLLGGVSGQVIRSAACPVIVVPRRAASAVGSVSRRRHDWRLARYLRTTPGSVRPMFQTILIGYDGPERGGEAIALAEVLGDPDRARCSWPPCTPRPG